LSAGCYFEKTMKRKVDLPRINLPGLSRAAGSMVRILKNPSLKAGLPPGTPVHVGKQQVETVQITITEYDRESYRTRTTAHPEECAAFRDKPTISWINVDGLHQVEIIEIICACFGIHPLTVEDICNTTQRPKLDIFDNYLFLVVKMQTYNTETHLVDTEQVSLVLGRNFLLTFRERAGELFDSVRSRLQNGAGRLRAMGSDYLTYTLLDRIIDNYFTVLESIGEEIELLEEEVIIAPQPQTIQKIHVLKRELILLRRSVWPLREVLNSLMRHDEVQLVSKDITIYIKDLYDHTIQVIETVETLRDITAGLLDIYLSSLSNRMNEIIKVLTIYAVIFIPLTFIAGVYGMNFNLEISPWNMPELNWYWGYPFALGLMALVAATMLVYFKHRKWL
jgi:magnesium transporter